MLIIENWYYLLIVTVLCYEIVILCVRIRQLNGRIGLLQDRKPRPIIYSIIIVVIVIVIVKVTRNYSLHPDSVRQVVEI